MKRYRVLKEFFVYAKDEYEAEAKSEDNKLKLPYILIDVQEMKEENEKILSVETRSCYVLSGS